MSDELPAMRQLIEPEDGSRDAEGSGPGVQKASMPALPPVLRVSPDGAGDRGADGGGDGAGDPAYAFFRQDAEGQGYVGDDGFAKYLKDNGIISEMRWRRSHSCTRRYLHEQLDEPCDCHFEITGLDIDQLRVQRGPYLHEQLGTDRRRSKTLDDDDDLL